MYFFLHFMATWQFKIKDNKTIYCARNFRSASLVVIIRFSFLWLVILCVLLLKVEPKLFFNIYSAQAFMTLSCHLIRCICNKSQSLNIWKSKLCFTLGVDKEMPPLPLSDQWLPSAPWSSTLFKQLRLSRNNNPYCLTPVSSFFCQHSGYVLSMFHLCSVFGFVKVLSLICLCFVYVHYNYVPTIFC